MGGDHKCPVCQATFTRPQHVARHMRSHTGDRPYKCQFCGDQFARSDLLARHVNKCHANEKLPPSTAVPGTRRKGSTAVSRATTSKQACDQCVQSSLPCDGSNPCSKCISRKCRCTYVKFHRQTAPSGPGHHPPPRSSASSSASSLSFDDFMIPALPPISAADQVFNTPFTFNPSAYSSNHWTTAPDMVQMPFSMAHPRSSQPMVTNTAHQSIYATQQHPPHWYPPTWADPTSYQHPHQHSMDDTKLNGTIARTNSLTCSEPSSFAPGFYVAGSIGSAYRPRRASLDFSDSSSATSQSVPSSAASSNLQLPLSGTEMYDGRSEADIQRPGSIPNSQPQPSLFDPSSEAPTSSQPPPLPSHSQLQRVGEGGFSSAFGLMSIDDANALAGIPSDGVSFFSSMNMGVLPNSPNATPMPARVHHSTSHHQLLQGRERGMSLGALPTPGLPSKEATPDAKELWKTYMRSPLSGPDVPVTQPQPVSLAQMPQSPSAGQRRRMRVSSLPSVTPTVEKGHPLMMNGEGAGAGAGVGVRPTLHGNQEDLRSYEAAVNARASLKLNLVPKRRGTRASPQPMESGVGISPSSAVPAVGLGGESAEQESRPSSSGSTSSSSLAQAFTVPCFSSSSHSSLQQHHHHGQHSHSHAHLVKPPPMQGASISLPIPPSASVPTFSLSLDSGPGSRASSVTSDGTGTGGSGSDGDVFRPSFKRYPSQTLGPANSKRALVERERGPPGATTTTTTTKGVGKMELLRMSVDEDDWECRMAPARESERSREKGGVRGFFSGATTGSRRIAALPERAKRRLDA